MKNKYEIRGDITVIFLLRRDKTVIETVIDTDDLPEVDAFDGTWYASYDNRREYFYVTMDRKRISHHLARELLNVPSGFVVDHINQNTLDNRRSNLRIATIAENAQNQRLNRNSTSGIRGVYYRRDRDKWQASIQLKGKKKFIGIYGTPEDAERAVIKARREYMPFSQEATKTIAQ